MDVSQVRSTLPDGAELKMCTWEVGLLARGAGWGRVHFILHAMSDLVFALEQRVKDVRSIDAL